MFGRVGIRTSKTEVPLAKKPTKPTGLCSPRGNGWMTLAPRHSHICGNNGRFRLAARTQAEGAGRMPARPFGLALLQVARFVVKEDVSGNINCLSVSLRGHPTGRRSLGLRAPTQYCRCGGGCPWVRERHSETPPYRFIRLAIRSSTTDGSASVEVSPNAP